MELPFILATLGADISNIMYKRKKEEHLPWEIENYPSSLRSGWKYHFL